MKPIIPIITIFSAFICCNGVEPKDAKKEVPKKDSVKPVAVIDSVKKDEVTYQSLVYAPFNPDNQFNNVTAVISGLKGKAHKLNYLFDSVAWSAHGEFIDKSWKKLENKRLKSMRTWAEKEFAKPNAESKVSVYPFTGPE